jgi:hypothetical protein
LNFDFSEPILSLVVTYIICKNYFLPIPNDVESNYLTKIFRQIPSFIGKGIFTAGSKGECVGALILVMASAFARFEFKEKSPLIRASNQMLSLSSLEISDSADERNQLSLIRESSADSDSKRNNDAFTSPK